MPTIEFPGEVQAVFEHFLSCEFATLSKDLTPIAWPMTTIYLPEKQRFLLATSIGFPQKALNIRRHSPVSLLFSDPTGSGLSESPAVLIQGNGEVLDEVITWNEDLERLWLSVFRRQPVGNEVINHESAWYYMRLLIYVRPHRIRWWPEGDLNQQAQEIEVPDVE